MLYVVYVSFTSLDSSSFGLALAGLPGEVPQHIVEQLFWSLVITIGQIYRRLVRPYRKPPYCLARICDDRLANEFKQQLAQWVVRLPDCCCCSAFMKPLKDALTCPDDLVFGNGRKMLEAAFTGTNTNVQVENCFARATSMQRDTRSVQSNTSSFWKALFGWNQEDSRSLHDSQAAGTSSTTCHHPTTARRFSGSMRTCSTWIRSELKSFVLLSLFDLIMIMIHNNCKF